MCFDAWLERGSLDHHFDSALQPNVQMLLPEEDAFNHCDHVLIDSVCNFNSVCNVNPNDFCFALAYDDADVECHSNLVCASGSNAPGDEVNPGSSPWANQMTSLSVEDDALQWLTFC